WIDDGGVLVRFAGPRLAAADDELVPVKLRRGGRILGGSLSWDQPQHLAGFSRESPFVGMPVPTDVTVTRQVLAEPDSGLSARTRVLDGFGQFESPPPTARPVPANYAGRAKADNPPGFYGPPEGLLAVNTLTPADRIAPIDVRPLNARIEPYRIGEPEDLRGPIFLAALGLLLLDALVVFWLAGGIYRLLPRRRIATALLLAVGLSACASLTIAPAFAADAAAGGFAKKATNETRLAYVITGDAEVDSISKAGLAGLTLYLAQRTALEAGE